MLRTIRFFSCLSSRRNLWKFFCASICLALFTVEGSIPLRANEQQESQNQDKTMFRAAEEFSACAGAYEALSKILKSVGNSDNLSMVSHETANGAKLAGMFFAGQVTKNPADFVNEKAKTVESGWLAQFEVSDEKLLDDAFGRLNAKITECSEKYSKIQGEIAQGTRRKAYEMVDSFTPEQNLQGDSSLEQQRQEALQNARNRVYENNMPIQAYKDLFSAKSIQCKFGGGYSTSWESGKPKSDFGDMGATITFDSINPQNGSARMIGNAGAADILAIPTETSLNFLERTPGGNLNLTTIFPYHDKQDSLHFIATMSRHVVTLKSPLPSQYHGTCDIWD